MTLQVTDLSNAFNDLVVHPPISITEAAQRWSDIYFKYAQNALALSSKPTLTETSKALLSQTFLTAMQAQQFLVQLPAALTAFWLSPPVAFAGATGAGPASSITGTATFVASVSTMALRNAANPPSNPLDSLATAIDVFTKSIIVNLVNPAGVIIPSPVF